MPRTAASAALDPHLRHVLTHLVAQLGDRITAPAPVYVSTRQVWEMLGVGRDKFYADIIKHKKFPRAVALSESNRKLYLADEIREFARQIAHTR